MLGAFSGDVYMRALERGICTGEMGLFGYHPGLGGIWVIPKGRPDGIEPVPPRSQIRQLTCDSGRYHQHTIVGLWSCLGHLGCELVDGWPMRTWAANAYMGMVRRSPCVVPSWERKVLPSTKS